MSELQPGTAQVPAKAEIPPWVEWAHGVESIVTTIGLLVAAYWAWRGDWRKTRAEREKDQDLRQKEQQQRVDALAQQSKQLRWDQANLARQINDQFMDEFEVQQVLGLVDFDGDSWTIRDKADAGQIKSYLFSLRDKEDVKAMRVSEPVTAEKEIYLRQCFDAWFYFMSLMEQHLRNDLIRQDDIDYPSSYYVRRLRARPDLFQACEEYIEHYGLAGNVLAFLRRF